MTKISVTSLKRGTTNDGPLNPLSLRLRTPHPLRVLPRRDILHNFNASTPFKRLARLRSLLPRQSHLGRLVPAMVVQYLFGYERYITCLRCPYAVRITTWKCVPVEFNKWNKCDACRGVWSNINGRISLSLRHRTIPCMQHVPRSL